jgi:hypothetical protein
MWHHKKFPGKKFKMVRGFGFYSGFYQRTVYQLRYDGPRGGLITDTYFSWQDAHAAGWRKCK